MNARNKIQDIGKGHSPYFQPDVINLVGKISGIMRRKMFESLIHITRPGAETTVLDVGVGSERREDGNFFEKLYSYPHMITAVGTENAYFLEKEFPGLKFIKGDGRNLPFPDKSFSLVVSFATIEHVGSRDKQRKLIHEICRVGQTCCITTPNRWYPIELHTLLPFVHWLPPSWFRLICRCLGKEFFAKEENLNPLSEKDVLDMFPKGVRAYTRRFRLFGFVSNLMFYVKG